MSKVLIYSVKNWGGNHYNSNIYNSCYKLKKSKDYFKFLFGILKIRGIPLPYLYNEKGEEETIFERENTCIVYESPKGDIIEITSKEFIFLIVLNGDDKIREYILKNTKFVSLKK